MTRIRKFLPFIAAFLLLAGVGIFRWAIHRHAHTFPSAIVIHESASTWGDANTIRRWHRSRGWSDIGYHAVILNGRRSAHGRYNPSLDGKIEQGRPENQKGCHCSADDMNSVALGVCLIGVPGHNGYPTKPQIDSLIDYLAARCLKYEIPTSAITEHSDHDPRKPHDASLIVPQIRAMVDLRMKTLAGR